MSLKNKIKKFRRKNYREIIVASFFLIFFFTIVKTIYSYTVTDYDFYKKKTDMQHNKEKVLEVSR
jgi:cell division protein FtsI/penicillin-binding protein 2